jgi:hypothetical protein
MLTDLRKKLEPVGRLDVMDTVGRRALTYYAAQDVRALDPDSLGRRARALQLVAEVRNLRGDSEGALKAFRQSAVTTGELLSRDPKNGQRIFDHAQSVFWVGYVAWQRGDLKTGRDFFSQYLDHAQTLAKMDPANNAWNGEVGYASQSLGILELDDNHAPQALRDFDVAEHVWAKITPHATDKRETIYQRAQAIAWKADARRELLDLSGALEERRRETALYRQMLAADPNDSKAKEGLAVAQYRTAQLQLETGSPREAAATATSSFDTIGKLREQDASNRLWQEIAIKAANIRTEALMMSGDRAEAREANAWALDNASKLVAVDRTVADWRTDCLLPARWMQIALSQADGAAAPQEIASFGRDFSWNAAKPSGEERFAWIMVDMLDGAHWRSAGDAARAHSSFARAAARLPIGAIDDARLLAVAAYLKSYRLSSGLPATASASASPVRYDVGALLGNRKG